jgi:hypothetical protein
VARSSLAGIAYFAIVFAFGFAFGALRVLLLEPVLGELGATFVELPFILAVAWLVCRWLIVRLSVPAGVRPRLVMGGVAFGLLLTAELALSIVVFDKGLFEVLAGFSELPRLVGLIGQALFGLMPVLKR